MVFIVLSTRSLSSLRLKWRLHVFQTVRNGIEKRAILDANREKVCARWPSTTNIVTIQTLY